MTAIVGTLNRRGVAFAADSAATHTSSSTSKITNHANKIFALSKKHPVGIAIYNNLDFHGIPWETLFKVYRDKHLKDTSYPKLMDYVNDFVTYISSEILPKVGDEQKRHVAFLTDNLRKESLETAEKTLQDKGSTYNQSDIFVESVSFLNDIASSYAKHTRCLGFDGYTEIDLVSYAEDVIDEVLKDTLSDPCCHPDYKSSFITALFNIMMSERNVYFLPTGLVFWGFGEDELFPSYYSYEVSMAIDGRVKRRKDAEYEVSNDQNACVAPFAQYDVSSTVVFGIAPKLRETYENNYIASFSDFRDEIVKVLSTSGAPTKLTDALQKLDISTYTNPMLDVINQYIQEQHVQKLLDTVAYLSKEDLAEMAESLVKMTCLKRHITPEEESVGGPVDVAVITKGDGFVWIKRKHYFPAELNHHFFDR